MRASSSTASSSPSKCFISFQLMPLRIALQPWMSYQVRWRWCLWCLLCPLQSSILIWIFLKMRNEIGVLPTWIKIWNEFINVELSILSSNVFFRLLIWCKRITFVIRFFLFSLLRLLLNIIQTSQLLIIFWIHFFDEFGSWHKLHASF